MEWCHIVSKACDIIHAQPSSSKLADAIKSFSNDKMRREEKTQAIDPGTSTS